MLPIKTILHPTDFSEQSGYALSLACALSRDYGARLVLLHVFQMPVSYAGEGMIPPLGEDLRADEEERLWQLHVPDENIRAERQLEEGDPASLICSVADDIKADLIVMGTHGRTGLNRLLMGSVAEQVVRRAECPVLTLTKPLNARNKVAAASVIQEESVAIPVF